MAYNYDQRVAATFDPSVLGYTQSEIESMSPDERVATAVSVLNEAADKLNAIVSAFSAELSSSHKSDLRGAYREVISVARALK